MRYRAEIDGLRAVAVVPVILFHAGYETFGGGYVGVDVFFVISGYLITSIILFQMDAGKFSLLDFYERRARRILPALFLVMAACIPFAWVWLMPRDMEDFARSLIAVATFSSNILFWRESGYFDTAAELKPLLHTWSLAVEEQYYILFPLFLLLAWRLGKRWLIVIFVAMFVASLTAAHWGAYNKPAAAFYLLPTRGWEILLGASAAFYFNRYDRRPRPKYLNDVLGLTGLALIVYAVFSFDESTPFPSLYALVPTVGTLLIILCADKKTVANRILGNRVLVGLGLISYSAYLWHQPLLAFTRYRSLAEPSSTHTALLCAAILPLAYLSWRFIEKPFRRGDVLAQRVLFGACALIALVFIHFGLTGTRTEGFAARLQVPATVTESIKRSSRQNECFDLDLVHERKDWVCALGRNDARPTFMVFGDSHALALLDAFDMAAREAQVGGRFTGASGCPPLAGIVALRNDQDARNCLLLNDRVYEFVSTNRTIKTVYLVARWTYYTDGGYSGTDWSDIGFTGLSPTGESRMDQNRNAFLLGLSETLRRYESIGVAVNIVRQIPQQKYDPAKMFYRVLWGSMDNLYKQQQLRGFSVQRQDFSQLHSFVDQAISRFGEHPGLTVLSFDDILCDVAVCPIGDLSGFYYYDDDHLSLKGSQRLEGQIAQSLRNPAR